MANDTKKLVQAEKLLNDMKLKCRKLHAELDSKQRLISDLKPQLTSFEQDNHRLNKKLSVVESRNDELNAELQLLKQTLREATDQNLHGRYQSLRGTLSKNNNTRTSRLSQMNEALLAEELEKKYLLMVQRKIIPQLKFEEEVEALKALSQQYVINKSNITGFLDEIRELIEENERLFIENEKLKEENDELHGS